MKKLVSLFLALVMVRSMMTFASAEEPFVITLEKLGQDSRRITLEGVAYADLSL